MQRLPILNPNKNGVKLIHDSKAGLLTLFFLAEGLWSDANEESCGRLDYYQIHRHSYMRYKYLRGSVIRPSIALAITVAGLARKMRASGEPMRPL